MQEVDQITVYLMYFFKLGELALTAINPGPEQYGGVSPDKNSIGDDPQAL
jgi:hypothetical protein